MGSSSDESFVWEKASTGSDDSIEMKLPINNDDSEEEMKVYNAKQTHLEVSDSNNEPKKEKKPHKRKRKSDPTENEEADSPKQKRIKSEPGSDSDPIKIKKKKKDKDITNGPSDDSINYEDKYLNLRVKQEKELLESASLEESKKNKKWESSHNASIDDNEIATLTNGSIQNEKKSNKKKKINKENSLTLGESFNVQEQSQLSEEELKEVSHKSAKKKKCEEKTLSKSRDKVDDNIDKKESLKKASKRTKYETTSVENRSGYSSEENIGVNNELAKGKHSDNLKNEDNDDYATSNHKSNKSIAKSATQRTQRLSDRIKFEDEIESDSHSAIHTTFQNTKEDPLTHPHSPHLKKFLKENDALHSISNCSNENAGISDDDEIWILKCPHDVNVNKLNNTDINLDNKCKIKINGETYCGNFGDSVEINVMSSTKKDFKIKKMVPNGIIHYRKRLPKPHFQKDNVMVNNQTDFIPLPATKCRHPLFGSNYKDAINVSIKCLNSSQDINASYSAVKKKKKKHKKKYDIEVELQKPKVEYDSESSLKKTPKEELDQDSKPKKAKKRKHSNDNDHVGKKSKKIKLEPDSAEAWASEKAIEENLFNF